MPARTTAPPFAALLEAHGPAVLRFCVAQAGQDRGEDIFQEAMISALRAYDTLRDPTAARSWLFSIAARKAIDSHRAERRSPVPLGTVDAGATDAGEMVGGGATGPGGTVRGERAFGESVPGEGVPGESVLGELWDEVARLPDKQRQALGLRFIADLSHREIGEVMGTSEAAARRNVFEGVRRLREDLTDRAGASVSRS